MGWEEIGLVFSVVATVGAGSVVLGRATWKLASTLTKLANAVEHLTTWFDDHEVRIRKLETHE